MPKTNWPKFLREKDVQISNPNKFWFDLRKRAVQMMEDLYLVASSKKMPKKQLYEIFVRNYPLVCKLVGELAEKSKLHEPQEMKRIGKLEGLLIGLDIKYDWYRLFTDEAYRERKKLQAKSSKKRVTEPLPFIVLEEDELHEQKKEGNDC